MTWRAGNKNARLEELIAVILAAQYEVCDPDAYAHAEEKQAPGWTPAPGQGKVGVPRRTAAPEPTTEPE